VRIPGTAYAVAFAAALSGTTMTGGASAEPMVAVALSASHLEPVDVAKQAGETLSALHATADVELDTKWRGLAAGCSYLAPKGDFVRADGTVDVVFHFHAGQMSERQLRESGLRAVFVACGYGIGSGAYSDAFNDQGRFGRMTDALLKDVGTLAHRRDVKLGNLALASWSAGFGAVGKILGVPRYYDQVDSVVLLDSLHSQYKTGKKAPLQGTEQVDLKMMASFVKFAKDAASGKKAMFVSHSSIIPPDYASSAEATTALLGAIGVPTEEREEKTARGMTMYYRADAGDLHVRGFLGRGPKDHFAHLYLVGEALRSWVVPRWKP
jgi:hypothetical protein